MRRDDPNVYEVSPQTPLPASPEAIIDTLTPLVTPARRARFDSVAAGRTHRVSVVLEAIDDPHNTSAVFRSCDAFGVQRIHVVPGRHGLLAAHKVSKGTHRWLDLVAHPDAKACADALHAEGYRILIATMEGESRPEDLREGRVAIVLGNEHAGVSSTLRNHADGTYAVPMKGFVESLNVSVAAATTLYTATAGQPGDLSDSERAELVARWLMLTVKDAERVIRERSAGTR